MIWIDRDHCKGCGACVAACAAGALRLVDGIAQVNLDVCIDCEACVYACPEHAILVISEPEMASGSRVPAPRSALPAENRSSGPVTWLVAKALPWASAALPIVASEVLPRVTNAVLSALQRREEASSRAGSTGSGRGAGHGRAHRHRHG